MTISPEGLSLIKTFEGLVLHPYKDSVGVPTIGYGSTYCYCGTKITMNFPTITEPVAEFMLVHNVQIYANAVISALTHPATQHQFDSMVSLTYNIGVNNFKNSTLVKDFNAGQLQKAADQFTVWRLAGGVVNQGLVNRRAKERAYFLS